MQMVGLAPYTERLKQRRQLMLNVWDNVVRGRKRTRSRKRSNIIALIGVIVLITLAILSLLSQPNVHIKCDTAQAAESRIVFMSETVPEQVNRSLPVFRIIVLTQSRPESLQRLLSSLRDAKYDAYQADLDIWVDRLDSKDVDAWHFDGTFGYQRTVDESVIHVGKKFDWPHGNKRVHVWQRQVGIWGQWIDTWRPSGVDDDEFAVLLEDDLQVSPLYFRWLVTARHAYDSRNDVFGYTLQRGTLRANQTGFGRRPLRVSEEEEAYLYLLLGSWGYAPKAGSWAAFREWFHEKSCDESFKPYVHGLIPTKWYMKQERRRTMWTMWHICYAHLQKLYTVYANLPEDRTLAANWREPGLHFRGKDKSEGRKRASAVTRQKDFALLGDEEDGKLNDAFRFRFPQPPVLLRWNGTYDPRKTSSDERMS
ncbi:hypothetical protein FGB62_22g110 [Gracilaria domingensis]|nr:hypothetical protein FGB62_22g110 [Gracilaria domingensis]